MRSFVAKRFETRPAGLSLDTEALARYADVIDLSIGDTDFTTDKRIIDAAYADALNGYTHYGDPKGDPELVDAVIQAWKEDFGQDIPREEVLVTTSSSIGMAFIKSYAAICLEGCVILLACIIFSQFASSPPDVTEGLAPATVVWNYIGELVFNMLVLVGSIKMSDRIIRELMGLG